ncbi:MAG TPA: hypothetical protein VER33_11420 [Polyangiaceae bacterium]|nr:hypothetical protein [Polyangiaceae bacterium]
MLFLLGAGSASSPQVTSSRMGALGPLGAYLLAAGQRTGFEGRVVARLDAGSYRYLQVERADGSRSWVVTLTSSAQTSSGASRVWVVPVGHAARFASKRLGRDFNDLYFGLVRPR